MNKLKRQVILDIETTGLSPRDGHRVVEIGAIELMDEVVTGRLFYRRINPEREIDPQVSSIIGASLDSLKSEPIFGTVAEELLEFISGAELIMHNARFDLEFLNAELAMCGMTELTNSMIDTLAIARALHPGQKNHLDALCERYHIDLDLSDWHGMLQVVKAIADVYLAMSADWKSFVDEVGNKTCESDEEDGAKFLDLAEAKRFLVTHPPTLNADADLSAFTDGTSEAFDFLGKQGYDGWITIGLTKLDQDIARALVGLDAVLIFLNIQNLDVEVARILSEGLSILSFDSSSLGDVRPELARELAKARSSLHLRIGYLSLAAAHELAAHADELTLLLDTPPDEQVLRALCFHAGWRLHVQWERPAGFAPLEFSHGNPDRKEVFVLPNYYEQVGRWVENVYIGDVDFYPDSLVDENGIATLL